jgi:hypothetical protein
MEIRFVISMIPSPREVGVKLRSRVALATSHRRGAVLTTVVTRRSRGSLHSGARLVVSLG